MTLFFVAVQARLWPGGLRKGLQRPLNRIVRKNSVQDQLVEPLDSGTVQWNLFEWNPSGSISLDASCGKHQPLEWDTNKCIMSLLFSCFCSFDAIKDLLFQDT